MSSSQSSPSRDLAIRLRDVEVKYDGFRALRGVDFSVPKGSLCGLIGPNGAGKTTTMRLVAADLSPTEGELEVLGLPLPRDAERIRPRLGYMPDNAGLYEELTLNEYLEFFAAFAGVPGKRRKEATAAAIELASVGSLANRRLAGLSKGERQRVLLTRTLVHDPDLYILDEPADGLDPRGRVELRELLLLLHERGKTILISSHILADLQEICTHLVFIDKGRVVHQGSKAALFAAGPLRATIRLESLDPVAGLVERLQRMTEVGIVDFEGFRVEIDAPAEVEWSHRLLKSLVEEGFRLSSFSRSTESLESVYLRMTETAAEQVE